MVNDWLTGRRRRDQFATPARQPAALLRAAQEAGSDVINSRGRHRIAPAELGVAILFQFVDGAGRPAACRRIARALRTRSAAQSPSRNKRDPGTLGTNPGSPPSGWPCPPQRVRESGPTEDGRGLWLKEGYDRNNCGPSLLKDLSVRLLGGGSKVMSSRVAFLRRQAEFYLRSSRSSPDPRKAEQLRLVAVEYFRMATEAESVETSEDKSRDWPR
jgi:hypothetical protein